MIQDAKEFYNNIKKESINCPVCDFNEYSTLHNQDRYGMGIQTVICNQCSLIYLNPRPTEVEMSIFYKEHYRKFYESVDRPTKEYVEKGPFIPRAKFVIEVLKPYLNQANSIIDVGCAEGTLLNRIEQQYEELNTFGIEPSKTFGEYAKTTLRGEVFIGNYQEYIENSSTKTYDIVTCNHVLEHILEPKKFLKTLKAFMHAESVLYLEVPNIDNNWVNGIGALHIGHVLYFAPYTLKTILEGCGLEIISFYTKDLPAKTPAMSVVCKLSTNNLKLKYPSKKEILKSQNKFREKVIGDNLGSKKGRTNTFFKKIKTRFLE